MRKGSKGVTCAIWENLLAPDETVRTNDVKGNKTISCVFYIEKYRVQLFDYLLVSLLVETKFDVYIPL